MHHELFDIKDASNLLCDSAHPGMSPHRPCGTNISV